MEPTIDSLIDRLRDLLDGIEDAPVRLAPRTAGEPVEAAPTSLPVLSALPVLRDQAPPLARAAVEALCAAAGALTWRQTYGAKAGRAFLDNYGWAELIGPDGYRREQGFRAGLLILGPDTHYPPHSHPALEHYVPLSGLAEWFDEDLGWRPVPPLRTVVHRPMVRHAMRTDDQPLLAYYLWSGEGLGVSARLSE